MYLPTPPIWLEVPHPFIHFLKPVCVQSLPDTMLGDGYTEISRAQQPAESRRDEKIKHSGLG